MTFSRRWIALFILGILPLLLVGASPGFFVLALVWYTVLLAATLADWRTLPDSKALRAEREVEEKLRYGEANEVRVRVRNGANRPLRIELRDSPPVGVPGDHPETAFDFTLAPNARHAAVYHLTPRQRGDFRFGDIYLRVYGRFGLTRQTISGAAAQNVKVYPSLTNNATFNLMARRGRLQQSGIRAARLQGAGREFESLRDYEPDDEMRRIDWKATARRGRLISRQYEVERSQTVFLVLDIGRTMLAEVDGVPKLDYAIQAALLLAYVATQTEDRIGLMVFSDTVKTYLPPKKGRAQVYAILEALYNVKATLIEPDYRAAFSELRMRWRKRSLLVCFTDLWDADSSRQAVAELATLQPRHLVAAVTLLDTKIQRAAEREPNSPAAVYEKAVAGQILDERTKALGTLEQRGVLVVDSPAEKLSADLVNKYLEIKQRMML